MIKQFREPADVIRTNYLFPQPVPGKKQVSRKAFKATFERSHSGLRRPVLKLPLKLPGARVWRPHGCNPTRLLAQRTVRGTWYTSRAQCCDPRCGEDSSVTLDFVGKKRKFTVKRCGDMIIGGRLGTQRKFQASIFTESVSQANKTSIY